MSCATKWFQCVVTVALCFFVLLTTMSCFGNRYQTFISGEDCPRFSFDYSSRYRVLYDNISSNHIKAILEIQRPYNSKFGFPLLHIDITENLGGIIDTQAKVELRLTALQQRDNFVLIDDSEIVISGIKTKNFRYSFSDSAELNLGNFIIFYRNGLVNTSGKPTYYTQVARDFAYAPTPDSAYVVEMTYYKKPTRMSDTNPSNEYLTYCPDLLLYGALAESAPYLMDDARLTTWQALYNVGLASLTKSSEESEYPAQPLAVQLS